MRNKGYDDETLVMLTLAGEQNAYEVLVERYQTAVIRSAYRITGKIHIAEDVAQDAFVTAWIKLNTLREPSKYGGWVCRIARNCAINTMNRYQSFLPFEVTDYLPLADDRTADPESLYVSSEEKKELDGSVDRLPERIREIITLHYYEGLSIAEISHRMNISEGTVKSQLHDGRKRIRRELCAMNEKWNDTFVQRVMKKVEELKLWQMKNSKEGFETVYKDVLRDIDSLPESQDKNHALADVLMRGWWWLQGPKNDTLFERIRLAAEKGKNEEVMMFIVSSEDSRVSGEARIEFIRDKQIPRLEGLGFVIALAHEWFWLGRAYYAIGQTENGDEAYLKAKALLPEGDIFRVLCELSPVVDRKNIEYSAKEGSKYRVHAGCAEYRYSGNDIRFWAFQTVSYGKNLYSFDSMLNLFRTASLCDGKFFDKGLAIGEKYVGSDGSELIFVSDSERVDTACGVFDGCQKWTTKHYGQYSGHSVYNLYYKEGVGIVRSEHILYGVTLGVVLKEYQINGGDGLLPVAKGNRWVYSACLPEDCISFSLEQKICYTDEKGFTVSSFAELERFKYDENSWEDMMLQIRIEYCDHKDVLQDVSYPMKRARELAKTSAQKAHTDAALSVAKRIFETDEDFNPNRKQSGHWNFFSRNHVHAQNGKLYCEHSSIWSFEWKIGPWSNARYPLLYNDIYGILSDATTCIWSDEWQVGASPVVEYCIFDRRNVKTQIVCTEEKMVTTKAGSFENCLKLELDIGGMTEGWSYRGGKHIYYFAEGVGIVKTEIFYCGGARKAVYELTEYRGLGQGFMPVEDGLFRRYDAIGLTDGYVGWSEYTYVADEDGEVYIMSDRAGIRNIPDPVSCYSSIDGEIKEDKLWNEKKREESRLRHDINNFNIILHYLGRPKKLYGVPQKALEWGRHSLKMMEVLGEGGQVPEAWMGRYGEMLFRTACYCFGCGNRDEGYEYLDRAFEVYLKWAEVPAGTPLEVGNSQIYGGIKYLKDRSQIMLPDGRVEAIEYGGILELNARFLYRSLTAKHGWEWFDGVRKEDRYKAYTEKIRQYADREAKA